MQQAVDLAERQQISVLGASNYYDYDVYGDLGELSLRRGIYPLFGLEIIAMSEALRLAGAKVNDPGNPGKIYICGKAITRFAPMSPDAKRLLNVIRGNDSCRMTLMTARLAEIFQRHGVNTGLDSRPSLIAWSGGTTAHANRFIYRNGTFARPFRNDSLNWFPPTNALPGWRRFLARRRRAVRMMPWASRIKSAHLMKTGKPAFVDEAFLSLEDAYRLICELGGIPCYPVLADGQNPISAFEGPVELADRQSSRRQGLDGRIHSRATRWKRWKKYVPALRAAGFAVTAGTEHNTLDLSAIEPTCVKGQPVPPAIMAIFREGACVAVAHQQLVMNGQCGFTDDLGRLNPKYSSNDQRLKELACLGLRSSKKSRCVNICKPYCSMESNQCRRRKPILSNSNRRTSTR